MALIKIMLHIQLISANAFKLVNEGREVAGYALGEREYLAKPRGVFFNSRFICTVYDRRIVEYANNCSKQYASL